MHGANADILTSLSFDVYFYSIWSISFLSHVFSLDTISCLGPVILCFENMTVIYDPFSFWKWLHCVSYFYILFAALQSKADFHVLWNKMCVICQCVSMASMQQTFDKMYMAVMSLTTTCGLQNSSKTDVSSLTNIPNGRANGIFLYFTKLRNKIIVIFFEELRLRVWTVGSLTDIIGLARYQQARGPNPLPLWRALPNPHLFLKQHDGDIIKLHSTLPRLPFIELELKLGKSAWELLARLQGKFFWPFCFDSNFSLMSLYYYMVDSCAKWHGSERTTCATYFLQSSRNLQTVVGFRSSCAVLSPPFNLAAMVYVKYSWIWRETVNKYIN